jgi:hypothetical protein
VHHVEERLHAHRRVALVHDEEDENEREEENGIVRRRA